MNIPVNKQQPYSGIMVKVDPLAALDYTPTTTLVLADRCDHCGAQAYGSALLPGAEHPLLFCAHHFTAYESKLREVRASLVDERHRVNETELARKRDGVSPA